MIAPRHGYVLLLTVACSAQSVEPPGATDSSSAAGASTNVPGGTSGAPPSAGGAAGAAPAAGGTQATAGSLGLGGTAAGAAGQSGSNAGTTASAGAAGASAGGAGGAGGGTSANLALNHCDKAGCTAQWNNDPCNAFDGDLSTVTGAAKAWDSSLGTLALDFGATQTITKVVVSFEDNADPNPGYALEGSTDGKSWMLIKDVANPSLVDAQVDLNASFRYLRVHSKQFFFDPWWMHSIREVEVR